MDHHFLIIGLHIVPTTILIINIITMQWSVKEASHIDYVHEKRHMFVSLETPPPPLEMSHIVIDSYIIHSYFVLMTHKVIFKEHFLLFDRSSRLTFFREI